MKKGLVLFTVLVFLPGIAAAARIRGLLKAQYFFPEEKAFQEIYGSGLMYGGTICAGLWKNLELWIDAGIFRKEGELTFTREKTALKIIPIGTGVFCVLSAGKIIFYGGAGLNYYTYKESSPIGSVNENAVGFVGKAGGYVGIYEGLILDLTVSYSYCKLKPADFEINIGGSALGLGIGYSF